MAQGSNEAFSLLHTNLEVIITYCLVFSEVQIGLDYILCVKCEIYFHIV